MPYLPQSKLAQWRKDNTPALCPILGVKMQNPAVDHCHTSGMVRAVLSSEGNAFLGRIENAHKRLSKHAKGKELAEVLRNMADFLDRPTTNVLHPVGAVQLKKRFLSMKKDMQVSILKGLMKNNKKYQDTCISSLTNSKERAKLYSKLIKEA